MQRRNVEVIDDLGRNWKINIVPCLDKLQWCADRRRDDTMLHTRRSDLRLHERVGNRCAVPRRKDIDTIDRSQTYVQTIKC